MASLGLPGGCPTDSLSLAPLYLPFLALSVPLLALPEQASTSAVSPLGLSAAHLAAQEGHTEVLRLLLEHGTTRKEAAGQEVREGCWAAREEEGGEGEEEGWGSRMLVGAAAWDRPRLARSRAAF